MSYVARTPEMLPSPCPVERSDKYPSVFLRSANNIVDESVNFLDRRVYIVASSNGFLLFNSQRVNKQRIYYVYSPVMKWCLALPKTKICIKNPAVGFICKLDVPLGLCPSLHRETSSAGVIDGVFCWLDQQPQITVYDSVHKCIWALELPQEIVAGNRCFLGISGGELYLVLNDRFGEAITVWYLQSNIRNRDAVWVRKYVANVATTLVQCPQANFGLASSHLIVVTEVTGSENASLKFDGWSHGDL